MLILASTSIYRKELLNRLDLPFITASPQVEETPLPGESPEQLVRRLAEAKARAVAGQYPNDFIIGSDQVAVIGDQILGKPGNHERAVAQLRMASGKRLVFLTGLCLLNSSSGLVQTDVVSFAVVFCRLSDRHIADYLRR